jgi:hypothetical protein
MKVSQTDPYSGATADLLLSHGRAGRLKMPEECAISFLLRGFAGVPNSGRQLALLSGAATE